MNSNQNNVHPKENIPSENHTKVGIVKEKSKEQDDQCASTCSCEEESITGMEQGVTDTVWKAGCYKINPTTQSGEQFLISKYQLAKSLLSLNVIKNHSHEICMMKIIIIFRAKMFLFTYDGITFNSNHGTSHTKLSDNEYNIDLPGKNCDN